MIVPAIHSAAGTVSKNGLSNGLFFGDKIDTLHSYNPGDITAPRGYRRSFVGHGHAKRPGAYDPKVTRVGVAKQAP